MAGYFGNIPTPQATQTRDTFTATASQTSFATSGYTVGMLDVYLNGIKLASADFTATNGSDVVLASGASADDIVEVVSFSTFESDSGTFTGAVTVGADLTVDTSTLKVDSSNNRVGIGTASPHTTTEIVTTASGSVSESLQIRNNATASGTGSKIRMINSTDANSDANSVSITSNRTNGDNFMTFETEDSERMRIDASGKIGIGTTSPQQQIHSAHASGTNALRVSGIGVNNACVEIGYDSSVGPYIMAGSSGQADLHIYVDRTSIAAEFRSNGDFYSNDGTVHSLSDIRIKKDVADLTDGLDIVKQLKPKTFKYTEDSEYYNEKAKDKIKYGFIANEVEVVAPQYTDTGDGRIGGKEVDDFKTLSTTKMIPMLVKAIQELSAKNDTLETQVADLITRVKALEDK